MIPEDMRLTPLAKDTKEKTECPVCCNHMLKQEAQGDYKGVQSWLYTCLCGAHITMALSTIESRR